MRTNFWLIIGLLVIFCVGSWLICSGLAPKIEILTNDRSLTMREWLLERGVVMRSDSPKAKEIYRFLIVSDQKTIKNSLNDARWEHYLGGGEVLYFLFTDTPPSVK